MISLKNVDLQSIKGKNLLFGFSLDAGHLTSVRVLDKTSSARPSLAGWILTDAPDDSATEEFRLADAAAWLAVHAPGWGQIHHADLTFNDVGKLINLQEN